jgi:hypothetical protein
MLIWKLAVGGILAVRENTNKSYTGDVVEQVAVERIR